MASKNVTTKKNTLLNWTLLRKGGFWTKGKKFTYSRCKLAWKTINFIAKLYGKNSSFFNFSPSKCFTKILWQVDCNELWNLQVFFYFLCGIFTNSFSHWIIQRQKLLWCIFNETEDTFWPQDKICNCSRKCF